MAQFSRFFTATWVATVMTSVLLAGCSSGGPAYPTLLQSTKIDQPLLTQAEQQETLKALTQEQQSHAERARTAINASSQ